MKAIFLVVLLAALAYAALTALAHLVADRLIFLPPSSSYGAEDLPITFAPGLDGHPVAILHLPHESAQFTLLFSHGNAEDLGHATPFLAELGRRLGVSVVGYDYRGYGLSSGGPPTAHGAVRDLDAVYRHLVQVLQIPPTRIILHGRSVGTGPTLELAAREPVGGVIVESGFTSAYRVMTRVALLPFDRFPNLRNIRRMSAPVLLIHGERDEVIPFSHGRQLYQAAQEPKAHLWVPDARHNDLLFVAGEDYWDAITTFIDRLPAQAAENR